MTYRTAHRMLLVSVGISAIGILGCIVQYCHWYAENIII